MDNLTITTATKKDLADLRRDIAQETRVEVAKAVDPLKDEMADVKKRLTALEHHEPQTQTPSAMNREMQALVKSLDPSFRRVCLIGMPERLSALDRIKTVNDFLAAKHPEVKTIDVDNFFKGPVHDRKLSGATFIEFSNPDAARNFFEDVPKRAEQSHS